MALPIAPTPILKGKDAKRFLKKIENMKNYIPTKESIDEARRGEQIYKKVLENRL